jgi:uncharacterized protein YndB with AHSA1/START domain
MHIEVRLPAPADTVFDAWLLPEVMQRWLFVGPLNKILEVTSDERAGGRFYIREENNGTQIDHYGEYLRVERPTLIEFTLEVPLHFQGVSRLKVELQAIEGGCTLALTQTGAGPANADGVWRSMLSGLQRVLLGKPAVGGDEDSTRA